MTIPVLFVILSLNCVSSPQTVEPITSYDTNEYVLATDETNVDIMSEADLRDIAMQLSELHFLKKDYYMVLEENNILKWRIQVYEEHEDPWYDNAIVGFILGMGFTTLAVWGAGQLK